MTTPGSESNGASTTKRDSVFQRLHTGNGAFDIVGKRMRWYTSIGLLFVICVGAMAFSGFKLGIDFEGGTKIQLPAVGAQGPIRTAEVEEAYRSAIGSDPETTQSAGSGSSRTFQIRTETLNPDQVTKVKEALFNELQPLDSNGQPSQQVISDSAVSGTWGGEITRQALIALGVFLVLVAVFLTFYFEKWMAVAALIALICDVIITAGVYSILNFEVTPSTVIGLLTILGFSLYDTVVVFDKVKENTRGLLGLTRRTYAEAANLAVNQTLMRSINTSVIALLPVIGLLAVGAGVLGVGVLRDLALVQLIGMIAGVVSSIFLATPLLVDFKLRDPKYRAQAEKVRQRREKATHKAQTGEDAEEKDPETVRAEVRQERAVATASSVPARTGKGPESRRRPSGKSGRPGKKRRS